ncbi:MAG: DUF2169 domain-containing protein [Sterolibacteriaceae bacterium]|nr:DUF2169 domain-containing protein [Sterolibacteriaceae bacterium]
MPYVTNVTPFQALGIEHRFYNGHPYDCLFVKATFRICHDGQLRPLVRQPPFVLNDLHEGDEDTSALQYASEIIPFKPGTDVIVTGNAGSPGGEPRAQWLAQLQVGPLNKIVKLTGPRYWRHKRLDRWELTGIEPCGAVRLSYALAYGGASDQQTDEQDACWDNPFGLGFQGRNKIDKSRPYAAPRIVSADAGDPKWGGRMRTVGLSPVDGRQMDRLQFAGTYDEKWQREVAPNIPLDMRMEYWNVVPPDQVAKPYLAGGETVRTAGLFSTPDGRQAFVLPRYQVRAVPIRGETKHAGSAMELDTVLIDLDKRHVVLRWATLYSQTEGYDEYELIALPDKAAQDAGASGNNKS